MGFLNNIILLFAAFAAVPILIHLLNRQRVRTVYFSSLRYLKNLQKTRMRRLKIKQLLLLLLRMLIVILVVAAFARPTIRSGYTAGLGAAAKTSAVIMLDNSLSMSAETRNGSLFEQGRDFAAELLQILGDGDEVLFGTFNKDLEPAGDASTLDFANASKLIGRSDQSSLTTDPQNSLASALEHAGRSGNLNREVYVISDFSEYGWDNLSGERFTDPPEGTGLYLVPIVDRDPDNVKVTGIDFGRQLIYPDRPVEIGVQLTNDNKRVSGVLTSLFVDGIRVSQAGCDIDAYSDGQISFKHTFEEQGLHHGFVELPDDAILADNKFYFSLSIPRRINVLIVGESERDNLYLKLAVRPRADGPTQIELKSIGLASLSGEDLFRFDCVILSGIDYMSEAAFSAVDNFASSGGGLLIFVPPTADSRFYSSRILKKRFAGDIAGIGEVSEGKGFFLLERLMMTHPIFSRYSEIERDNLPEIKFEKIVNIRSSSSSRVLAWFSSGSPAILESEWGQGRAILFGADPMPESNELVRHPLFVTFVNRAIEYLSADMTRISERFYVGDVVARDLAGLKRGERVELIAPDGSRSYLTPKFAGKSAHLSISDVYAPGIYQIVVGDSLIDQFAVNVRAEETKQRYLDPASVAKRLERFGPTLLSAENDSFLEVIRQNRHGREIWKPILLLTLGLLALEMFIARSSRSAPEQTP